MQHTNTTLSPPPSKGLMWSSYLLAIIFAVIALSSQHLFALPPLPLLTVLYWSNLDLKHTYLPTAFILGLIYDALSQSTLGVHALLFVIITFIVLRYRLRFRLFTAPQQAAILTLLFYPYQLLKLLMTPSILTLGIPTEYWLAPLSVLILWPILSFSLQMLQHQFKS